VNVAVIPALILWLLTAGGDLDDSDMDDSVSEQHSNDDEHDKRSRPKGFAIASQVHDDDFLGESDSEEGEHKDVDGLLQDDAEDEGDEDEDKDGKHKLGQLDESELLEQDDAELGTKEQGLDGV
jgi:hypothetical protein